MPTNTLNITEETILKRYEALPQDLKDAVAGIGTANELYKIGKNANLSIEGIGKLAEETGLIILGFVPASNFISDIKQKIGIDEAKAGEIASEVNARIFLPIRESLKRMHGTSWSEGITKPPIEITRPKIAEERPAPPEPKETTPVAEIKKPEPLIIQPMGIAPRPAPPKPLLPPTPPPPPIPPMPPERKPFPAVKPPEIKIAVPPPPPPIRLAPQRISPPEINPHTFPHGVEPREKDLKTSFAPGGKPQNILEGGGIKKDFIPQQSPRSPSPPTPPRPLEPEKPKIQIPHPPQQPGFDPYREPLE